MQNKMKWIIDQALKRPPGFVIGDPNDPYLLRWFLIPRNRIFNIYLHCFLKSDDDRALHDHPWINLSILLDGSYVEHTIEAGGIHKRVRYHAGAVRLRLSGKMAHRIEISDGPCWTIFITGPRYRDWGFHCAHGFIPWQKFVDPVNFGQTGKGCDQ